jgi:peptide/nickel transport system permease protein
MRRYIARRLLLFVPSLLGATLLIFVLLRLVPGDIAEIIVYQAGSESSAIQQKQVQQIRRELGLDRPVAEQYLRWLGHAALGDFGYSYVQRRPVSQIVWERFPRSLELAVLTLIVAVVWAVPLGVVSAARQNTWVDHCVRVVSISGLSLPIFFSGVLILYALVRFFRWLPPLEFVSLFDDPVENLKQLVWPTLAQAYYISAPIMRLTRSQMLEVVRQDYVRTARAKGLPEDAVLYRHALRNGLLPFVTMLGLLIPGLIGGSVIFETIFAWPGIGRLGYEAILARDYPVVIALNFIAALLTVVGTLLSDVLYMLVDPRIRL